MSIPDAIILGGEKYLVRPVTSPQLMLDLSLSQQEASTGSQGLRLAAAALGLSLPALVKEKPPIRWSDYNANAFQYGGAVIVRLHEKRVKVDEWSTHALDLFADMRERYMSDFFTEDEVVAAEDFSEAGEAGGS